MKKVILINLLAVTFIFFLLEFAIRIFNTVGLQGYDKNIFFQKDGITFSKPNKTFKVFGIKSKTDNYGYRIPLDDFSYDIKKKYDLILGDSVTYGVGVKEKESFIGILRKKNYERNILNSAISGHNLKSYLYILEKNQDKFKNNLKNIVIFLCLNDIVHHQGVIKKKVLDRKKINEDRFEYLIKNNFIIKLNFLLREKSYLFVFLKGLLTNPTKRHFEYMNILYQDENNISNFKNYIIRINQFSLKNDLNLNFVLLPYSFQIQNNCKKKFLKPQETINHIFRSLNIKLNDYTKELCSNSLKTDLFLPYDPVHLSVEGHKYVSELLIRDKIFK